jgi:DNA-binding NarL/FixJ family response regulator
MNPIICFIDDSKFEHELVRHEIAPCAPTFQFVQAYSFEEAKSLLQNALPALFLLDLWGQDDTVVSPQITPMEDALEKIDGFPTLADAYAGLHDFKGDIHNEYLKRFFAIVDSWRSLFETVCEKVGQNRKYGLSNLNQVRRHYPGVPAVFYTRKSLISDAVAIFKAGADGLFIKPTGKTDNDTHRLTRENAPLLMKDLERILYDFSGNL